MTNTKTNTPFLHTKAIIFTVTLFLSAFFGGVLYCQNLYETGRNKDIPPVIIGCLLWNYLSHKVLGYLSIQDSFSLLFIPNIISAIIFIAVLWNYHFKNIEEYHRKKVWVPLALVLFIYTLFVSLNILRK